MSEKQKLRDQVAELAKAVEALTEKLGQHCCGHHVCWHYYQYSLTTGAATNVLPYTVTYKSSPGSIGTG